MRALARIALRAILVAGCVGAGSCAEPTAGADARTEAVSTPIVVELFTSQGCSSCPSADRYLTELAGRKDVEIIPMSFHVDYWNYIGWTDPFSSETWSDRQRRYAKAFGSSRVYTPQMVINGRWHGVGSSRRDIARLLERAQAEPPQARMSVSAKAVSDARLRIEVIVDRIEKTVESKRLTAWVAVVENDLETPVGRGENASKTLHNDAVVRLLRRISDFEPSVPGAVGTLEIALQDNWRRDQLGVVTFLKEADSLRIHAAAGSGLAD